MAHMKWFMFLFLAFAMGNLLFGVAEYSYLGPYANQAVWAPFFQTFEITAAEAAAGETTRLATPAHYIDSIFQMFKWNYVMLYDGLGAMVRYVILWPISAAMVIGLALTLWQSIPFFGRGS